MKKFIAPILFIILLFIIRTIILSFNTLWSNSQAVSGLKDKVTSEQKQNQFLTERLYYVQTNEFIEREAREKLSMVKNGEQIVIAPPPKNQEKTPYIPEEANWKKWLKLFL